MLSAKLNGEWPDASALVPRRSREGSQLSCTPATLWTGVTDARGIRAARITLQGRDRQVVPGAGDTAAGQKFQAIWPEAESLEQTQPVHAAVELELVGTEDLAFAPIGDSTRVTLKSDWPHPSQSPVRDRSTMALS